MTHCPNKDLCGSCGWSHIPYDNQLKQKLADINGSLALKKISLECHDILPSPQTEHYRNRMDFVIDFEGRVGLREKGKWWRVLDGHPCFIGATQIDQLFYAARDWVRASPLSRFDRKSYKGFLRYVVVRSTLTGQSMVTIVTSAPISSEEEQQALTELQQLNDLLKPTTLIWSINHTTSDISVGDELRTISGPGRICEEISGYRYLISPHAFFQTNSYAAPLLLESVRRQCGQLNGRKLLDLYCGTGFFSIALARECGQVVGVELVADAIQDARQNAVANQVTVDYRDIKAEDFSWTEHHPDVVIVDPPRSGMHPRALEALIKAAPPTIVYISCNYKSFAHELLSLLDRYDVRSMQAIDMFPHTPHVELVSRLELKSS